MTPEEHANEAWIALNLLCRKDFTVEQNFKAAVRAAVTNAVRDERKRCAKIARQFAEVDLADEDGDQGRVPFKIEKAIQDDLDV